MVVGTKLEGLWARRESAFAECGNRKWWIFESDMTIRGDVVDANWLASSNKGRFVVPEIRALWEKCNSFEHLVEFATVTKGV